MSALANLVLLGWIPFVLVLFATLRPPIAALATLALGSLFLPNLTIGLPGPVDLGKFEAIGLSLLIGIAVFDSGRLAQFRPRAADLLAVLFLASGSISSLTNDLGGYDAFAVFLNRFVRTAFPYFVGSLYLGSADGLRRALWAFFLSALVYVPFCLYEVRMSPQLHAKVYGFSQHAFDQTMRGGGYRPMVFMSHGLELSLWLAAGTIAGLWLWKSRQKPPFAMRLGPMVGLVAATLVLCKSTGAIMLAAIGAVALSQPGRRWLCAALLVGVPIYIFSRVFGDGALERQFVEWASLVSDDRAGSLSFRFENEVILLQKLWNNPWFGAGGWNFGYLIDPETAELVPIVTDSMWIIAVATTGIVGLVATTGMLWLPALRGTGLVGGVAAWRSPERLTACIVLTMLVLDSMVNGFAPPLYYAIAGGLARVPLTVAAADATAAAGDEVPAAARARAALRSRADQPQPTGWLAPSRGGVDPLRSRGGG
jgi:hypothetical protein